VYSCLDDKLVLNLGNIQVYCRIRPSFQVESRNIVDFIREDGSLLILDPSKTLKDRRKRFQFNSVFGPTTGQGRVVIAKIVFGTSVTTFFSYHPFVEI